MRSKTVKARVKANRIRRTERHETAQWDAVYEKQQAELEARRAKYIAEHGEEAYQKEIRRQIEAGQKKLARNSQYGAHASTGSYYGAPMPNDEANARYQRDAHEQAKRDNGAFPDPSWIQL